jgi:hypothetical protein
MLSDSSKRFLKWCANSRKCGNKTVPLEDNAKRGSTDVGFSEAIWLELTDQLRELGFNQSTAEPQIEEWLVLIGFAIGWYEAKFDPSWAPVQSLRRAKDAGCFSFEIDICEIEEKP